MATFKIGDETMTESTVLGILERMRGVKKQEVQLRQKQSELKVESNRLEKLLNEELDKEFKQ